MCRNVLNVLVAGNMLSGVKVRCVMFAVHAQKGEIKKYVVIVKMTPPWWVTHTIFVVAVGRIHVIAYVQNVMLVSLGSPPTRCAMRVGKKMTLLCARSVKRDAVIMAQTCAFVAGDSLSVLTVAVVWVAPMIIPLVLTVMIVMVLLAVMNPM